MKLSIERHAWPIPRPYIERGWEAETIWVAFVIGNRFTDDIFSLSLNHTLSERQYSWLVRLFT